MVRTIKPDELAAKAGKSDEHSSGNGSYMEEFDAALNDGSDQEIESNGSDTPEVHSGDEKNDKEEENEDDDGEKEDDKMEEDENESEDEEVESPPKKKATRSRSKTPVGSRRRLPRTTSQTASTETSKAVVPKKLPARKQTTAVTLPTFKITGSTASYGQMIIETLFSSKPSRKGMSYVMLLKTMIERYERNFIKKNVDRAVRECLETGQLVKVSGGETGLNGRFKLSENAKLKSIKESKKKAKEAAKISKTKKVLAIVKKKKSKSADVSGSSSEESKSTKKRKTADTSGSEDEPPKKTKKREKVSEAIKKTSTKGKEKLKNNKVVRKVTKKRSVNLNDSMASQSSAKSTASDTSGRATKKKKTSIRKKVVAAVKSPKTKKSKVEAKSPGTSGSKSNKETTNRDSKKMTAKSKIQAIVRSKK